MSELTVVFYPVRSNKELEAKNKEDNRKAESVGNNVGRKSQLGIVSFDEEVLVFLQWEH